jgi:hypothetical protein
MNLRKELCENARGMCLTVGGFSEITTNGATGLELLQLSIWAMLL